MKVKVMRNTNFYRRNRERMMGRHREAKIRGLPKLPRQVTVKVMAVRGVYIRAQPQTRICGTQACGLGPQGKRGEHRRGFLGGEALLQAKRHGLWRFVTTPRPGLHERMIVIAGNNHDLSPGERSAKIFEKGTCNGKRIAARAVAQLEHVAKQDKSIDVLQRVDQCGAGSGTAQHVGARAGTEMQI